MRRIAPVAALLWANVAGALDLPGAPPLGSSLDALDRSHFACAAAAPGSVCRYQPDSKLVLENQPARAVVLYYRGGVLARATVAIDETRFHALLGSLSATLGAGEERPEKLKAGMGGVFPNRIYVWRDRGRTVMLEQYFERVVYSGVSVMSDREFEALMTERDSSRVRGVRDL